MEPYQEMYYKLFNKLTDISLEIQKIQQETEELFLAFQETAGDEHASQ